MNEYLLEHVKGLLEKRNGRGVFSDGQVHPQEQLLGTDVVDQGVRQCHRRQPVRHAVVGEETAAQQLPGRYAHHGCQKNKKIKFYKFSKKLKN